MGKGRKPKPAELRVLQGNPGHRKIPDVPKSAPVDGKFPPPEWMDAEAKKEWRKIVKAYESVKMITETDLQLLTAWCTAVSQFISAHKELKKAERKKTKTLEDYKLIRLCQISINEARAALLAISSRFGFSPVDRMKLALPPDKPDEEKDFEKFLRKKA
jgi:P27 family predicted phage terminase small subunit